MEKQELYQDFKSKLSSLTTAREIDQWWSWVLDFLDFDEEGAVQRVEKIIQDLSNKRPIQYIFQKAFFYDLELMVNDAVLIPRPETEELVEWASAHVKPSNRILDIGTGSGAIALMIKKKHPSAEVLGVDISEETLAVAQHNVDHLGLRVQLERADLFDILSFSELGTFDIIVCNPPYIPSTERENMTANTIHEPELALFAPNDDVVGVYKSVLNIAKAQLRKGGLLFLELNEFWLEKIQDMVIQMDKSSTVKMDMQGKARMLMVQF